MQKILFFVIIRVIPHRNNLRNNMLIAPIFGVLRNDLNDDIVDFKSHCVDAIVSESKQDLQKVLVYVRLVADY